jgi:predicted HAD superfamily phosphohydrolase
VWGLASTEAEGAGFHITLPDGCLESESHLLLSRYRENSKEMFREMLCPQRYVVSTTYRQYVMCNAEHNTCQESHLVCTSLAIQLYLPMNDTVESDVGAEYNPVSENKIYTQ